MSEREEQLKKGEKIVKTAKNWNDYWRGIDMIISSEGVDTEEQYNKMEEKLDKKYGHTLDY